MAQKYFIYSFVARGPVILAEHAEKSGTFTGVASECLKKLPTTHTKFTYNWDGLTFNFLVEGPFTYCVVATDVAKRNLSNALLERVKDDFTKRYAGGKAANAYANSLSKEFGLYSLSCSHLCLLLTFVDVLILCFMKSRPKMKEHMQYFVSHPEEVDQLAKVKAQVAEVKETMIANIDKVVERGGNIEILIVKTENLRSQVNISQINLSLFILSTYRKTMYTYHLPNLLLSTDLSYA
ncbi:hypothetical protein QQ045_023449 [Rhodiola kirilowii]